MQRVQEEESHVYTPPPPYTLVDQQFPGNRNNNNSNNNNNNSNNPVQQQYHSQNPYPATVIPPDSDFRLAQKLQDEEYEYARWAESNPQQEYYPVRAGESSAGTQLLRSPMPPIPEHYQYNHHQSSSIHQSHQSQQYPIIYASPNQPPLPYTQNSPFNGENGGSGGQTYYGSLNQGYYPSSQSHPFYNAPYHNYQQIPQRNLPYHEEEDNSSCLSGFALASLMCFCWSLYDE